MKLCTYRCWFSCPANQICADLLGNPHEHFGVAEILEILPGVSIHSFAAN